MGGLWSKNPEKSVLSSGSFSLHTSVFPGSLSQLRPAPQRPNHCIATSRKWREQKRGKTSTTNDITKILFIYTKKEHRKHKTNISKLDNKQRAAPLPHTSPTLCLMFKLLGATTRCYCFKSNPDAVSIKCFYFWSLCPTGSSGKVAAFPEKNLSVEKEELWKTVCELINKQASFSLSLRWFFKRTRWATCVWNCW